MKFSKYNLAALLLIIAVLFTSTSVLAVTKDEIEGLNESIEEKNAKIKEIEKKINVYKKTIEKKRIERVSLTNQVGLIENRIEKAALDIESAELQLEETNLEIQTIDFAVEEKAKEIRSQKESIGQFVRMIHSQDQKSSIEVLAGYSRLSDFFADVQYTKTLHSALANTAKILQSAKIELDEQKVEKEEKKNSLEQLTEALAAKKEELKSQEYLKLGLIEETAQSEQKFKSLVSNLRDQYESIEGEIVGIERQIRQKLEDSDSFSDSGDLIMTWPVPSMYITSYFHDPDYPYRHVFEHSAIDIRAGQGTPIRAASSGFVARARTCSSHLCYSYVLIVHQQKVSTLYGHMSQISVKEGDFVARGEVIGLSGGTPGTVGAGPFVTGPHLHFETRVNGIPVNPLNYLQ